ncbi:MAG: ATPase [Prevotella sp.]
MDEKTIMIVDSGSTKADWCIATRNRLVCSVQTQGINPVHLSADEIQAVIKAELLPFVQDSPSEVYFYGSGVLPSLKPVMDNALKSVFAQAEKVCSESDLLGTARALLGRDAGVACILGTGSNSCYYDGRQITENTPPLGYILGDEGSGAALGIAFLNALYKGLLPDGMVAEFEQWAGMDYAQIIHRVYREPLANRWLASLSPYISGLCHGEHPVVQVKQLVINEFRSFIKRNIEVYFEACESERKVCAVGSVAYYYREEIEEALRRERGVLGTVLKSPMKGLLEYHGCVVGSF